jgi:hypothetical protein
MKMNDIVDRSPPRPPERAAFARAGVEPPLVAYEVKE